MTVNPDVINAVNDSARASSKVAGIALASVLANDFLGSVSEISDRRTLAGVARTRFGVMCLAMAITLDPIGTVRSRYTDTAEIPKGPGAQHDAEGVLEIRPELAEGLQDIEGFSHLYVIWVFDRAGAPSLVAHPPSDDRPHGVFATRSPQRPNPIGLTVVELLGRDGTRLKVRGVDMLDGTPIVDIKPYLSNVPADQLRRGWLDEAERRRANGELKNGVISSR